MEFYTSDAAKTTHTGAAPGPGAWLSNELCRQSWHRPSILGVERGKSCTSEILFT